MNVGRLMSSSETLMSNETVLASVSGTALMEWTSQLYEQYNLFSTMEAS